MLFGRTDREETEILTRLEERSELGPGEFLEESRSERHVALWESARNAERLFAERPRCLHRPLVGRRHLQPKLQ